MIKLPKGCYCSEFTVFPKNWKQADASTDIFWRISYRFYESLHKKEFPRGKQKVIKGMNKWKDLKSRQQTTHQLIANEMNRLQNGYNLITKKTIAPVVSFPDRFKKANGINYNEMF